MSFTVESMTVQSLADGTLSLAQHQHTQTHSKSDHKLSIEQLSKWYNYVLCTCEDENVEVYVKHTTDQEDPHQEDRSPIPYTPLQQKEYIYFSRPEKPAMKATMLHKLIEKKKWPEVRTCLKHEKGNSSYDENFYTPLLLACKKDAPIDIIEQILCIDPQIMEMPDSCGNHPLHLTCKYGTDINVMKKFLEKNPIVASKRNQKGCSPLQHVIERSGIFTEWIKELLFVAPVAAAFYDVNGDLPLHYCGKVSMDASTVQHMIDSCPIAVRKLNRYGAPPILLAASRNAPLEILQTLIAANPFMINVIDQRGMNSISALWCQHMERRKVDQRLEDRETWRVMENRQTLKNVKQYDDLTGKHKNWWVKLEYLIRSCVQKKLRSDNSFDAILTSRTNAKHHTMHCLALSDSPPELVQLFLTVYKDSMLTIDGKGRLPLHYAAAAQDCKLQPVDNTSSALMIDLFLRACPEATNVPDLDGRTPLHHALEAGKTWESGIRSLVETNSKSLLIPDFKSRLYPFLLSAVSDPGKVESSKRRVINEKVKNKHQIWNSSSTIGKESVMNEEVDIDNLSSLSTVYQMLRQKPSVLTKMLPETDDDELLLLRDMNKDLMEEKKTLRRALFNSYKEFDVMDKMYEIQKTSLKDEIIRLKAKIPVNLHKPSVLEKNLESTLSSALRKKDSIELARNKYIKGRVKFMPPSIIEFGNSDYGPGSENVDQVRDDDHT